MAEQKIEDKLTQLVADAVNEFAKGGVINFYDGKMPKIRNGTNRKPIYTCPVPDSGALMINGIIVNAPAEIIIAASWIDVVSKDGKSILRGAI